jgi:hypothetical protein
MPETFKTVYVGGPLHADVRQHTPQFLFHNRLLKERGWSYQLQSVEDLTCRDGTTDFYFYCGLGPTGENPVT